MHSSKYCTVYTISMMFSSDYYLLYSDDRGLRWMFFRSAHRQSSLRQRPGPGSHTRIPRKSELSLGNHHGGNVQILAPALGFLGKVDSVTTTSSPHRIFHLCIQQIKGYFATLGLFILFAVVFPPTLLRLYLTLYRGRVSGLPFHMIGEVSWEPRKRRAYLIPKRNFVPPRLKLDWEEESDDQEIQAYWNVDTKWFYVNKKCTDPNLNHARIQADERKGETKESKGTKNVVKCCKEYIVVYMYCPVPRVVT